MEKFIGLEVLFAASNVRSKYDASVCFLHWCLLQNQYKCKGLLNNEDETPLKLSELLPGGWNNDNDLYTLMYQSESTEDFILKILRVEDTLLVNIQRLKDDKVCSWSFETSNFVNESSNWCFEGTYKNLSKLQKELEQNLTQVFKTEKKKSGENCSSSLLEDSQSRNNREDSHYIHRQGVPHRQPDPYSMGVPRLDPFSVGVSDLDPFSSHSSGMLMDPARSGLGIQPLPNRMPRGSGLPGARFDPVAPIMNYQTPNPDHLPPPGFDDMYT
ncbi:proteasome inhibitor PI31 subunit-like [Antedon mediterranea]|uniref:proteasome inhibitor PI31 subunit-like n=1 Tax=Antedon mediterranea TaxID=105859 RepID=UPI003AF8B68B